MKDTEKDNLIECLYDTLNDEVKFCYLNGYEISERSLEILSRCHRLGYGKNEKGMNNENLQHRS